MIVALWAVLASGCSDTSDKDAAASPVTTVVPTTVVATTVVTPTTAVTRTTVTTKPAPAPTAAADRATAQRIVLTPADVPNMPAAKPSNYTEIYAQCGKNPLLPGGDDPRQAVPSAFLKDETAEVRRLQTTTLGGYAVLAPSEAAARSTIDTLRSPAFRTCLERELTAAANGHIASATPVVQAAATVELPTPATGDDVVAFRTTLTERNSRHVFELTVVRKGRALASVVTGRLGDVPFPDDERVRLARVMTGRMP
jgi:hypothetical protein